MAEGEGVLQALSVGTREQLATLLRLAIAEHLESAIISDDHLVQTDPSRLDWFREALLKTSAKAQVVVLTCRGRDYLAPEQVPGDGEESCEGAESLRVVALERCVKRWRPEEGGW